MHMFLPTRPWGRVEKFERIFRGGGLVAASHACRRTSSCLEGLCLCRSSRPLMKRHALLIALLSCTVLSHAHAVDERYKEYAPRPGLSGEATVAGAPAPARLMLLWSMSFHMLQPQTVLRIGAGSDVKVKTAVEAIAILVHEKNPLSCISRDELKRLYTEENPSWDM